MIMLPGIRRISLADVLGCLQGRGDFICFFVCVCVYNGLVAVCWLQCVCVLALCVCIGGSPSAMQFSFHDISEEVRIGTSGIRLPHPPRSSLQAVASLLDNSIPGCGLLV